MKHRFVIVASRFNEKYVNGMLDSALAILKSNSVDVVRVPGAFEIPLAVKRAIRRSKPEVVIALGVLWKGETLHAELMGTAVTNALMQLSLEHDVPIIHQVLTVSTEKEAKERCFGKKLNRGVEAAKAALALIDEESRHG